MWSIIATWRFSENLVKKAAPLLKDGNKAMDVALEVATQAEDDLSVDAVGTGSFPNADGVLELDAAVMDGTSLRFGAVAAVKNYPNPALIARDVMEHLQHNILVGEGAERFAQSRGYKQKNLLTSDMKKKWHEKMKSYDKNPFGHDTVGVVALSGGNIASVTSTSGLACKMPGRVGDSPIIGSGFYADSEAGGAAATGVGEDIMRGCTCHYAVELMRSGILPQHAAEKAVKNTHDLILRGGDKPGNIAIICADMNGNIGGAANHCNFCYAAASENMAPALYMAINIAQK